MSQLGFVGSGNKQQKQKELRRGKGKGVARLGREGKEDGKDTGVLPMVKMGKGENDRK